MRVIVAVAGAISALLLGVWALSLQAQEVKPTLNTSAENATYNATLGIVEGISSTGADGVVWFGVAAFVLVSLGYLVAAATGGGR